MWNAVRPVPLSIVDKDVRVSVVEPNQVADVLLGRHHPGEFLLGVLLRACAQVLADLGEKLLGSGWVHWRSPNVRMSLHLHVRWSPHFLSGPCVSPGACVPIIP